MDELIKALRCHQSKEGKRCLSCSISQQVYCDDRHDDEAADALEELQAQLKQVKTELTAYKQTGWEPCDYKLLGTYKDEADKARKELNEAVCEIAALRAQEAEKNEPLTLDELRQMDGEPVFISYPLTHSKGEWVIGDKYDAELAEFRSVNGSGPWFECDYGKVWLAYRHKPEEIMEMLKSKGRLQIYPCSIGDEVYYIKRYCGKPLGGPRKGHVQMLGTTRAGIRIKVREDHDHNSDFAFGKTVFLTESEAEAACERMEGNE